MKEKILNITISKEGKELGTALVPLDYLQRCFDKCGKSYIYCHHVYDKGQHVLNLSFKKFPQFEINKLLEERKAKVQKYLEGKKDVSRRPRSKAVAN